MKRIWTFIGALCKAFRAPPVILPRPAISLDDFRYIWNYQMIVIAPSTTIDLLDPLVDITLPVSDLRHKGASYPFIVGDHGLIIGASSARRTSDPKDPNNTSLYLEYVLNQDKKSKLILRIVGKDPQSLIVVRDERRTNDLPLILFLQKQHPQEK